MKITDLNKNNIDDIKYNNIGFQTHKLIAAQIIDKFVDIDNGIVDYNASEIDLIIAHIYLRLSTDLFDDVDIGDNEVNDILIRSGYLSGFMGETEESAFLHGYVWDSIKRLERINNIESLSKVTLFKLAEKVNSILDILLERTNDFNMIKTIDTLTNSFNKFVKSLDKKDVDKLKSIIKGDRNEIN